MRHYQQSRELPPQRYHEPWDEEMLYYFKKNQLQKKMQIRSEMFSDIASQGGSSFDSLKHTVLRQLINVRLMPKLAQISKCDLYLPNKYQYHF